MKLFKLSILKIALCLLVFTSCTSDDSIVNCTEDIIASYLVECPWDVNASSGDYVYIFNSDLSFSIILSDNSYSTSGTYSLSTNASGEIVVTMLEEFNDFNHEWTFSNCDFENLQVTSSDSNTNTIEINCSDNNDCTEDTIASYLVECPWDVNASSGDYVYIFNSDLSFSIILSDNSYSTSGTYSLSTNASGEIVVTMLEEFNDFNHEWTFSNCDFENLQVTSSDSNTNTIEINCSDNNDCTEDTIASYLVECPWDVNASSGDYVYIFNSDLSFSITLSDNSYSTSGTYSLSINASGEIIVTMLEEFNDFNHEWTFSNCDFENLQVTSSDPNTNIIEINC